MVIQGHRAKGTGGNFYSVLSSFQEVWASIATADIKYFQEGGEKKSALAKLFLGKDTFAQRSFSRWRVKLSTLSETSNLYTGRMIGNSYNYHLCLLTTSPTLFCAALESRLLVTLAAFNEVALKELFRNVAFVIIALCKERCTHSASYYCFTYDVLNKSRGSVNFAVSSALNNRPIRGGLPRRAQWSFFHLLRNTFVNKFDYCGLDVTETSTARCHYVAKLPPAQNGDIAAQEE